MEPPYILQLPPEILTHIASFVKVEPDLLELRLTCRSLAAAAFDLFANEFIANLRCFVLDPVRLHRVNSILSRPHLARKVREVTFTVDGCELPRWCLSGISMGPDHCKGMENFKREYVAHTEVDNYFRPTRDPITSILLRDILRSVKPFPKCIVTIDATYPLHLDEDLPRFCLTFLNNILEAMYVAEYNNIGNFYLSELVSFKRPSDRGVSLSLHSPGILSSLENVKSFGYKQVLPLQEVDDGGFDEENVVDQKAGLDIVMQHLMDLNEFHWHAPYDLWSTEFVPCPTPTLFDVGRFNSLRVLSLGGMICKYDKLRDTLHACKSTLTDLRFDELHLEHSHDVWKEVFYVLRGMPVLKNIRVDGRLMKGKPLDQHVAQFLLPGDEKLKRYRFLPEQTDLDASSFLDWNLEHGLTYFERDGGF
ncbi:hypothetical protein PRZ48_005664 [Zasmidium cellare]|uniref:F-box domain-containing protein n=1 Tax=Zasmidium cellare TaxID=395010 RepID=A0ABR0EKY1_ZASCE|nr:hypothetical protein PRZ48_005664 [Zasmidium cellare]